MTQLKKYNPTLFSGYTKLKIRLFIINAFNIHENEQPSKNVCCCIFRLENTAT